MNLFAELSKQKELITKENPNYWETNNISFGHSMINPNGDIYDERELYEEIMLSDINRLKRFG